MMDHFDSRILDINSEVFGVTVNDLMDNAGTALADVVRDMFRGKRILVVCGNGNNGGDGLAAAYHLLGENVTVALLSSPDRIKSEASKLRLGMLIMPKQFSELSVDDYDVVVDCVLGTGVRDEVYGDVADYIFKVNTFVGAVVSADIPTGFGTSKAIVPDVTVTFHDIKEGMNENNCGTIIVADIGIPPDAAFFVGPGDMLRYPIPEDWSHKGQNGRLLIVGGGPYIGAPALAAMAAQRIGVDLVRIATPKRSFIQISSMSPTFITFELSGDVVNEDDVPMLIEMSSNVDAVLIGPGIGTDERTVSAMKKFARSCKVPMIVDADAIAPLTSYRFKTPVIFTPNGKEMDRMLEISGEEFGEGLAKKFKNAVIVAKGEKDMITNGTRTRCNDTGCPAMTIGGTGDALAGIVAGLVSKGVDIFNAGCLGAYICGLAGEYAFMDCSYGMTALDLIECIPFVLKDHLE